MPDVSIAVSARDNFSPALRTMSSNTKAFSKDMDDLRHKLTEVGRTKARLTVDVTDAKRALKEAQKEYQNLSADATEAERTAARAKFEAAQENLDSLQAKVRAVGSDYRETTQAIRKLEGEAGKASASSRNSSGGESALLGFGKRLAASGILQTAEQAIGGYAAQNIMSALGKTEALYAGGLASGALSGAAAGAVAGPLGAAIGAAVGGASGLLGAHTQIQGEKDDAYKSYVQEAVQGVWEARASMLTSGSAIASGRETDLIGFTTLLGGDRSKAQAFLDETRAFAASTSFAYDDLTALSKTLMTFGYTAADVMPALTAVGDAGAALGLGTADMGYAATAIGRMRSTDKVSLEYLNMLTERGIGATQWIADAYGLSMGQTYEKISKGEFDGSEIAQLILDKMTELYGGSMEEQSKTFSGLQSTLEDMQAEVEAAYGEGYNETRKQGIQAEIDALSGEMGERMQEAYASIGAWEAELENIREQYIRDAVTAAMDSEEYQTAQANEDAAEMGRIIAAAQVNGESEYLANEGKDIELQSQLDLIESVQSDPTLLDAYETAGYTLGNAFTKGIRNCVQENLPNAVLGPAVEGVGAWGEVVDGSHASGLHRVPYDNYVAVLHEGEQILTANQARQGMPSGVTITGNTLIVREEADIDRVAWALYERMRTQSLAAAPN